MSVTQGYVTDVDIDEAYVATLVTDILPRMERITKVVDPLNSVIIEETIYKVLIYINSLILPRALYGTVAEMSARQSSEYSQGLDSSKQEDRVKKVSRSGFSQEFEKTGGSVPRGTQIMQDYVKYLNRFRKMRTI